MDRDIDLEKYWVCNIHQLACVMPFAKLSKRTLFRKMNAIRDFIKKPKAEGKPITLADVASFLKVNHQQLAKVVDFDRFDKC